MIYKRINSNQIEIEVNLQDGIYFELADYIENKTNEQGPVKIITKLLETPEMTSFISEVSGGAYCQMNVTVRGTPEGVIKILVSANKTDPNYTNEDGEISEIEALFELAVSKFGQYANYTWAKKLIDGLFVLRDKADEAYEKGEIGNAGYVSFMSSEILKMILLFSLGIGASGIKDNLDDFYTDVNELSNAICEGLENGEYTDETDEMADNDDIANSKPWAFVFKSLDDIERSFDVLSEGEIYKWKNDYVVITPDINNCLVEYCNTPLFEGEVEHIKEQGRRLCSVEEFKLTC